MFEKLLAKLAEHGVPKEVLDQARAIEGHAYTVGMKLLLEGKDDAVAFIKAEFEKAKAAVHSLTA